jgi:hypothetical protein
MIKKSQTSCPPFELSPKILSNFCALDCHASREIYSRELEFDIWCRWFLVRFYLVSGRILNYQTPSLKIRAVIPKNMKTGWLIQKKKCATWAHYPILFTAFFIANIRDTQNK